MTTVYKVRESGFAEIRKAIILNVVPIAILAAGAGIAISYFNAEGESSDVNVIVFVIPIILILVAFGIYKGINLQKVAFESYKLTLTENEVIKEQKDTERISIPHSEIKSIVKKPNGTLTIVGNASTDIIGVPSQINDKIKLEQLLSKIRPIIVSDKKPLIERFQSVAILSMVGLMFAVYLSFNKIIVGVSGTILILILTFSLYQIQRSKNINKKTKKAMWWGLLVLFSIISNMYFKLSISV